MSAYNTVSAKLKCPSCNSEVSVQVQFKFGNTWQFHYEIGDSLRWGGNDVGKPGSKHVVVDGILAQACPVCQYDDEWNVCVHVEDGRITRLENATGQIDFVRAGSNYVVSE